jgi:hypothetical protein
MSTWILDIAVGAFLPPALSSVLWWLVPGRRFSFFAGWFGGTTFPAVINTFVTHDWRMVSCELASFAAAVFAAAVLCWWFQRKRRDRAPKTYGTKSRALIAAMVTKAREAAKPRPVLKPVPHGGQ